MATRGKKAKKKAGKVNNKVAARNALFIEEYLANGRNATQAYLKFHPKVTEGTAKVQGHRLLTNPNVAKLLAEREEALRAKYRLTTDDLMRNLSQALNFDPRKLYNEDGSLKAITDLDDDTIAALASVEVTEVQSGNDTSLVVATKKIKWLDKNTVREQAMKHLGMFKDKGDTPPAQTLNLTVNLTPEEAHRRMLDAGKR